MSWGMKTTKTTRMARSTPNLVQNRRICRVSNPITVERSKD